MKRSHRRRVHFLTPKEMSDDADRMRQRRRRQAARPHVAPPSVHAPYPQTDVMIRCYILGSTPEPTLN
jgi:hypothetical protein